MNYVHMQIYANTRASILDAASNELYYTSESQASDAMPCSAVFTMHCGQQQTAMAPVAADNMEGLGSTHTPKGHVWPLAMIVEGLTSPSAATRITLLRRLLQLQVSLCASLASYAEL